MQSMSIILAQQPALRLQLPLRLHPPDSPIFQNGQLQGMTYPAVEASEVHVNPQTVTDPYRNKRRLSPPLSASLPARLPRLSTSARILVFTLAAPSVTGSRTLLLLSTRDTASSSLVAPKVSFFCSSLIS